MKKKNVATYYNAKSFYDDMDSFNKDVKVYVDSDLGNGIKGEEVARDINQKGFSEIYLCIGYRSSDFAPMPWVRGVVGKLPPLKPSLVKITESYIASMGI